MFLHLTSYLGKAIIFVNNKRKFKKKLSLILFIIFYFLYFFFSSFFSSIVFHFYINSFFWPFHFSFFFFACLPFLLFSFRISLSFPSFSIHLPFHLSFYSASFLLLTISRLRLPFLYNFLGESNLKKLFTPYQIMHIFSGSSHVWILSTVIHNREFTHFPIRLIMDNTLYF